MTWDMAICSLACSVCLSEAATEEYTVGTRAPSRTAESRVNRSIIFVRILSLLIFQPHYISVAITNSVIVRLPAKLQQLLINGSEEFEVKLFEGYSSNCVDMVSDDDAVFGIVYCDCDTSKFDVTTLDMVKQVIIVSREHPLAIKDEIEIKDLDNVPMAVPDEYSTPRIELSQKFEAAGARLNVAYVCNRPRQVIDIVSNNTGLAARTIADEITERDLEKVKVLELKNDPFLLPVNLIARKDRHFSMHERLFRHMIIDSSR